MAREFVIQSSDPRAELTWEAEDSSLSDAVQSVFPLHTERMLLTWNGIYVPLGYKYDVSLMVDDIVDLVTAMLTDSTGDKEVHWASNTFAVVWAVRWDVGYVAVTGNWTRVVGSTESLLAASGPIRILVEEFLREWRRPLEIVADALHRAGYSQEQLPRLAALDDVVRRLPRCGQLYEDSLRIGSAPSPGSIG